ncbi:MAG: Uma2 family endonuclease [Mastigocoleus sp. MO_167.B18]|uniref:Uma2 family endonuclease n=1 Tax=Mastigocoleus sp. MO_188.B34 TaxID=3036635 RepID=UPI00263315D0|nr:Uma2 family endonuclease [Mastigocoleus sp. MO_188.B34]MDJ0693365.1 Uma2 family endonuclease [Mastigocoleus sp. MO_188.B34]MDJ0771983.1 Uma2 family endonuclease [Mastigocoleus sp. MO_167.B18]
MLGSTQSLYLTPEEYLQVEEKNDRKHEYINGYLRKMSDVNDSHVTIAGNLAILIRDRVRVSGCRVYISDMKARIEKQNRYYYPDVMVSCDERDKENTTFKKFPCLIVEVLSDSTEAFDRGDKFADYQLLETLQEYVVINTKRQRVECFRRNNEGLWVLQSYTSEEKLFQLQSINFEGEMDALYEDVVFPETTLKEPN